MTLTTLLLQQPRLLPFLPDEYFQQPKSHTFSSIEVPNLTTPVIGQSTGLKASSSETVLTTRTASQLRPPILLTGREPPATVLDIHGWLDNIHLFYESWRSRHPNGSTVARTYKRDITAVRSTIDKCIEPAKKKARGAPKKIAPNRLKPYLKNFMFPREALRRLSMFDDIVTGAVQDSGGNTRPLSKTMMVSLLQGLDHIAADAIKVQTGSSLRHSQRIAMCLRVIERTAFKVAEKHWYLPDEPDWSIED